MNWLDTSCTDAELEAFRFTEARGTRYATVEAHDMTADIERIFHVCVLRPHSQLSTCEIAKSYAVLRGNVVPVVVG